MILASQSASRGVIFNAVGKSISITEGIPQRLAHLIQGVEASILKVVVEFYGENVVLLQHDGFASRVQLDIGLLEQVIHQRTGHHMRLEENRIDILPDLNETKL